MKEVVIPEGTERIGNHWFCCSEVERVEIPVSVKEIRTDAFYGCRSLKSVVFAEGSLLKMIGPGSFSDTGIEMVVIPKSVEEIQKRAFQLCESLKEVLFEEQNRLKTIGENTFSYCKNLAKITFPEGLETIGLGAFARSGLKDIEFPASLKTITQASFNECASL